MNDELLEPEDNLIPADPCKDGHGHEYMFLFRRHLRTTEYHRIYEIFQCSKCLNCIVDWSESGGALAIPSFTPMDDKDLE
jgi:hypothetical protein